jgi:hypothetical protein
MSSLVAPGGGVLEPGGAVREELRQRRAILAVLERRLHARETELDAVLTELGGFERRYEEVLGTRYARLFALFTRIDEERERAASPNGAEPRAHDRDGPAAANGYGNGGVNGYAPPGYGRPAPPESARQLFRKLARHIHPDLAPDAAERERRTRLMISANLAYEHGDTEALRSLLTEWENSPDNVQGTGVVADLTRVIRRITQVSARIKTVEAELRQLRDSQRMQLFTEVGAAAGRGTDLLAEMAVELDKLIARTEEELRRLLEDGTLLQAPTWR